MGRPGWTQSLAGHHWPQSARHMGPTRHSNWRTCRLLRATDSDRTCRPPASAHHGSTRPDKAVTSDKMFPGDDPLKGPGAASECQNSRTAGPPARAVQVLHRHRGRIDSTATSPQPPGRSNGHPDATSKKDLPDSPSSNSIFALCSYSHEQRRARHWPLAFSTLLTSTPLVCTLSPP